MVYPQIQNFYLKNNSQYEHYYLQQLKFINKADYLLSISKSSEEEVNRYLKIPSEKILNASEGCDTLFRPLKVSKKNKSEFFCKYGIDNFFILYTGGADGRKNLIRLIQAYGQLPLSLRQKYQLVFAGKIPPGDVENLKNKASAVGLRNNELVFTDYVTDEDLVMLYSLCKLFVFPSIHEGFGLPLLEAMSCGAAVIGSDTTSVPEVVGRKDVLFDPLNVEAIVEKIRDVLENDEFRAELAAYGLKQSKKFSWDESAQRAVSAFEQVHAMAQRTISPKFTQMEIVKHLVNAITYFIDPKKFTNAYGTCLAVLMARNHPDINRKSIIYIDVSELVRRDVGTGIQRVVRSILKELQLNHPVEFDVQAVYSPLGSCTYMHVNIYANKHLDKTANVENDIVMDPQCGDFFVGLDLQPQVVNECRNYYQFLRQHGVQVFFVVYDLLPIILPAAFPPEAGESHSRWLDVVTESNGAICISRAVAEDLRKWMTSKEQPLSRSFALRWFHLGADIKNSSPTQGLPPDAVAVVNQMRSRPAFLMVGTIEPRKGYEQVLRAFEILWSQGEEIILVIVGRQGWKVRSLIKSLGQHAESGKRLFWLEGISDEYLEKVYDASTCLLAASIGEGFGLPLIEAAQHKIPVIARDIPVFREVAGEGAFYFTGTTPQVLANSIKEWLALFNDGLAPLSEDIQYLTWAESADQFMEALLGGTGDLRTGEGGNLKRQRTLKHLNVNVSGVDPASVLLLSPYPIRKPRHGGQLRTTAIRNAFQNAGFTVQTIGFYQTEAYDSTDIDKFDIAFPSDSQYRLYGGKLLPVLSDFLMAAFSISDEQAFQQVVNNISSDIDVIVVEQPWFYPLAKRLKCEVPQCRKSYIVFSSQNVEASMKRQILESSTSSEIIETAVADISRLEELAAKEADLSVAVTKEDAAVLKSYGAANVLVAQNGINPWSASPERIDFWKTRLPTQPWPLFIASAHPPNYTEFIASVGDALGSIPPGSKLVVAGGVGPHLLQELSSSRWSDLNVSRLQVLGILDDADLNAVKSLSHAYLLPIGAGGGSNIKTAEALYSGKPVICTSMALRGFEAWRSLPGVWVADTPADFQTAIRSVLGTDSGMEIEEEEVNQSLREQLTWDETLQDFPQEVSRILATRDGV